jgi:hypothetical protein
MHLRNCCYSVVKKELAALVGAGIPVMHDSLLLQIREETDCASSKLKKRSVFL